MAEPWRNRLLLADGLATLYEGDAPLFECSEETCA